MTNFDYNISFLGWTLLRAQLIYHKIFYDRVSNPWQIFGKFGLVWHNPHLGKSVNVLWASKLHSTLHLNVSSCVNRFFN